MLLQAGGTPNVRLIPMPERDDPPGALLYPIPKPQTPPNIQYWDIGEKVRGGGLATRYEDRELHGVSLNPMGIWCKNGLFKAMLGLILNHMGLAQTAWAARRTCSLWVPMLKISGFGFRL